MPVMMTNSGGRGPLAFRTLAELFLMRPVRRPWDFRDFMHWIVASKRENRPRVRVPIEIPVGRQGPTLFGEGAEMQIVTIRNCR